MSWADYNFPDNIRLSRPWVIFRGLFEAIAERYNVAHQKPISDKAFQRLKRFDPQNSVSDIDGYISSLAGDYLFEDDLPDANLKNRTIADWATHLGEELITEPLLKPILFNEWAAQRYRILNAMHLTRCARYYKHLTGWGDYDNYSNQFLTVRLARNENSQWPTHVALPEISYSGWFPFSEKFSFQGGEEAISWSNGNFSTPKKEEVRLVYGYRLWIDKYKIIAYQPDISRKITVNVKILNTENDSPSTRTSAEQIIDNYPQGTTTEKSEFRLMGAANKQKFNEWYKVDGTSHYVDDEGYIIVEIPPGDEATRPIEIQNLGEFDEAEITSGTAVSEPRHSNISWSTETKVSFVQDFYCEGGFKFRPEAES